MGPNKPTCSGVNGEGECATGYGAHPRPRTAREALDLAWELAHPVEAGQTLPDGTRFLMRDEYGLLREDEILDNWEYNPPPDNIRTLDQLPNERTKHGTHKAGPSVHTQ